jgi:hypothetical protein
MDRYRVQWQAASGAWELPGCSEAEASFSSRRAADAAIASLRRDPDWRDATFRVLSLAESRAAAILGRKGGRIGGKATGAAKRRGDSEHYRALRAQANRCAYCEARPAKMVTIWSPCDKHGTYTRIEKVCCPEHANTYSERPHLFGVCDCGE